MLIELPHLAERTPAEVAVPGVSKIRVGIRLVTARKIELCGQLICDALVLSKAVVARRPDSLLIQALRIQFPACNAGDLGLDQRCAVPEILRTMLSQEIDLCAVGGECL